MKVTRMGGGVVVAFVLAACHGSITVGSGAGSPSTGGGTATGGRPVPAPAPLPHAPPPSTPPTPPTPAVTPPTPTPTTPASAQGPHQAGRLRRLTLRQTPPPTVTNTTVKRDASALTRFRQRTPAPCGPLEVAPGVIVHTDCVKYQPLTKAKFVSPLKRLGLLKRGRLTTDLDSVGGGMPKPSNVGDAPLPDTVDHRVDGTEGPVKDQDVVGSCTGFSLSTVVDNAIRRLNKADVISSMHIWSHYGYPNMSTAGDSNIQKPLAIWADWPYDPKLACRMYSGSNQFSCGQEFDPNVQQNSVSSDPAVQQQIKDADAKGKYKITNITRIYDGSGPPDTDALAGVLATGKDIWTAFTINNAAWGSRGASSGEIPDYDEGPGGGHAVVIAGYRTKNGTRQFLIHNSWTEKWGGPEKGYAWLSEKMVKQSLRDAYTIAITDLTAPPPPPPPPDPKADGTCQAGYAKLPGDATCYKSCKADADCGAGSSCSQATVCLQDNPLTDDDCADDELVDDVTKRCATMCPDDTRPHGGKCTGDGTGGGLPPKKR